MTLEKQVCSLELSKRLKELGVKQESAFQWVPYPDGSTKYGEWYLQAVPMRDGKGIYNMTGVSAFTVAELGELLPDIPHYRLRIEKIGSSWGVQFRAVSYDAPHGEVLFAWAASTEADARAKMLIYLLENKLISL